MNNNLKEVPLLSSERLGLRKIQVQDANEIYFLRSNPEVNKFILRTPTKNIEEAKSFIVDRLNDFKTRKVFFWAITLKDNPQLIGSICLWNFNEDKTIAEVGYDLHPDFQKKGIMNESLQLVLNFGFKQLQLITIEAFTHKENMGSIQLLKRNHFKLETNRIDEGFPHNIIFSLDQIKE